MHAQGQHLVMHTAHAKADIWYRTQLFQLTARQRPEWVPATLPTHIVVKHSQEVCKHGAEGVTEGREVQVVLSVIAHERVEGKGEPCIDWQNMRRQNQSGVDCEDVGFVTRMTSIWHLNSISKDTQLTTSVSG